MSPATEQSPDGTPRLLRMCKWVAIFVISAGALIMLGCSSELGREVHPWEGIDLPHEPWAPAIIDMPATALEITVNRDLQLSINSKVISVDDLSRALTARHKRYGEFPVIIGADQALAVEDLWPLVKICRETGIWRLHYAVYRDEAQELISYLAFTTPIEEGSGAKGPVIIKDPRHEDVLRVHVRRNGFTFQDGDHPAVAQEVDRQLGRLARMAEGLSVICVPEADATHAQVARFLGLCCKNGLHNLSVMTSAEFKGVIDEL